MAEVRDNQWWAICLDFDIAVQGESFFAVQDSLHKAIDMYLERVSELPADEQARLLRRRAPWYLQVKFHLLPLLARFADREGERRRQFVIPAHA